MMSYGQARPLDLGTVQAFVLVADLHSFTRAADAMETTQAAVSLKVKRLEERLGTRLIEHSSRMVRLSAQGAAFMDAARELLAAHDRALAGLGTVPRRLAVGISDHVAGPGLPSHLARMRGYDPGLVIEVRIAASHELLAAFDHDELDAVIIRSDGERRDGELVVEEPFRWFASPTWERCEGEPIPLATLSPTCGVRAIATQALDAAGIPWTEVFVGGGVAAVRAAVSAGLAIAALARRVAPADSVEVGERLGLPALPNADVRLYSTTLTDARARGALRTLAAAFRSEGR
jgi:DNA-binding transcriptional LysR family regulator